MGGCCVGDCCIGNCCVLDLCGDSGCCVGNATGPTESETHAKKVAEELAKMRESSSASSKEQEEDLIDDINTSMKEFLECIKELNNKKFDGESLRINIDLIKEKNEKLKKQVVGSISEVLNSRLVLTDKELSAILAEKDDSKRKKNFEAFVQRVKKEAQKKLKQNIEKTVAEQSKIVSDEIETRKKEVNQQLSETVKELSEIVEIKKKNSSDLEKKQFEYMYQCALCNILLDENDD